MESYYNISVPEVKIQLNNGLGDKLLDLIGFCVICKYLNYKPVVNFQNNGQFVWGNNNYDNRLFHFDNFMISDKECEFYTLEHLKWHG
jgi:hypothetical protein